MILPSSMGFKLLISKKAQNDLKQIDSVVAKRIVKKLKWFSKQSELEPFIVIMKKATTGDFRFRIGAYRALGVINSRHTIVTIISIGHRNDVYRL